MSSILSILEQHNIPYRTGGTHHHVTQGWYGIDCPWCSESGGFHLGIHLRSLRCSCWKCGGHSIASVLREIIELPWGEIRTLLDTLDVDSSYQEDEKALKRGKLIIPSEVGELLPCHINYLEGRGFDPATLQQMWGIKGIGISSYLSWRIWIPIHFHYKVVSWTTRSIGHVKARYINARAEEEIVSPKDILFGEDHIRHVVIITEGPFNVFRIGYGAVATMGVGYSKKQLNKLSQIPLRVVLFDSEEDAQRRAKILCNTLSNFPGETVNVILESGKDAAEASEEEITQLRKEYLH